MLQEAVASGARKTAACRTLGLTIRTVQRWFNARTGELFEDGRPQATRKPPPNKLTTKERARIIDVCNSKEFTNYTPSFIVPTLADSDEYIASESTFYRVLNDAGQLKKRIRKKQNTSIKKPSAQTATAPNQIWTWDISYLPSQTRGFHYYLYMIVDIFSRKIVGAEVYEQELGALAAELLQRTTWREGATNNGIVLHSDNGAPMRSFTMQAKMRALGVTSSYSRPRVSNDNPYSESLFKTTKYHHTWPAKGFNTIVDARAWVANFVVWYNTIHKHSAIKYVTPGQRHKKVDVQMLLKREHVYARAQQQNPSRWSQKTRNWQYISAVELNPDKKTAAYNKKRQLP